MTDRSHDTDREDERSIASGQPDRLSVTEADTAARSASFQPIHADELHIGFSHDSHLSPSSHQTLSPASPSVATPILHEPSSRSDAHSHPHPHPTAAADTDINGDNSDRLGHDVALSSMMTQDDEDEQAFRQRRHLYATYFFAAWGDRMWEFSAVLFIIDLFPASLFYSAFFGLVESVVAILFGPRVGTFIDKTDRLKTVQATIIGQNCSIAVAAVVFWLSLSAMPSSSSDSSAPSWIGWSYFVLLCLGGTAKVASIGNKISIHKDWLVVLAGHGHGPSSTLKQTQLNSAMRRIDLTCSILAPLFVGLISSASSSRTAVAFVGVWACMSIFVEMKLVRDVYTRIPKLQGKSLRALRERNMEAADGVEGMGMNEDVMDNVDAEIDPSSSSSSVVRSPAHASSFSFAGLTHSIRAFLVSSHAFLRHFLSSMHSWRRHLVFGASLSYCLLYISILSLGGLMASWMKVRGVDDVYLALARGFGALVGVGATYAVPSMVKRWGLIRAALVATWLQVVFLVPVVIAFVAFPSSASSATSSTTQIVVILVFLCLSRFGLWAFDLSQTQLMQSFVVGEDVGLINGAQESGVNLAYIGSFLLVLIFNDPTYFAVPAWISFVAVLGASMVYTRWSSRILQRSNPFPPARTWDLRATYEYEEAIPELMGGGGQHHDKEEPVKQQNEDNHNGETRASNEDGDTVGHSHLSLHTSSTLDDHSYGPCMTSSPSPPANDNNAVYGYYDDENDDDDEFGYVNQSPETHTGAEAHAQTQHNIPKQHHRQMNHHSHAGYEEAALAAAANHAPPM